MPPRKKTAESAAPEPINTYGFPLYGDMSQLDYDRLAFSKRIPITRGAPLRNKLFKKIADKMMPGHFEWHSWTNKVVDTLCDLQVEGAGKSAKFYVLAGFPGCSNAAKTRNITSFAAIWWLCDPEISSVTLISTSKGSLKKRAWSEISKCYSAYQETFKNPYGNLVDSRIVWQFKKGDDKHSIHGKAVEEGPTNKVADDIKGVHTTRQMIIIDEATSVPAAIYEACANLYSYPEEFILILIGNPLNRLDQFGRFCEPEDGWNSVNVDTGEWTGKPQDAVGGRRPSVVTFDATKSPNIVEGKVVSRHLPTQASVEAAIRASGGGNTPLFWQNMRGFWPPEGLTKTVFSEAGLTKVDAYGKLEFSGEQFVIIGFFDPAFGGNDRPALRFARMGIQMGGKWGIQSFPPIIIQLDSTSSNPIHFQLYEETKRHCENFEINGVKYSCSPDNFGMDSTGEGGGLADIMQRMWSANIIRVEFGSAPSDDPISLEDIRPSSQVFLNKRAEIYFRSRSMVDSGQWRGLDKDTASELTTMKFYDDKKRIVLMSKKDYKLEFKKSPDLGDCFCGLSEVARIRGFRLAPIEQTVQRFEAENEHTKLTQSIFEESDMYQPEDMNENVEALV